MGGTRRRVKDNKRERKNYNNNEDKGCKFCGKHNHNIMNCYKRKIEEFNTTGKIPDGTFCTKCKKFNFDIKTSEKPIALMGAIENKKLNEKQNEAV